ncbi:MAG: ATP-binding protein [Pseudomonadota bacterium]
MNLRRQLLIVSLTTLILPWAGCQFIQETESALRLGQQEMLAGTAQAIADSLSQYPEAFPPDVDPAFRIGEQLYGHPLEIEPRIDGYFEDWPLDDAALLALGRGSEEIRFAVGIRAGYIYLFAAVPDRSVVYLPPGAVPGAAAPHVDRVELRSLSPPYLDESLVFAAGAPGRLVTYLRSPTGITAEPTVLARWQDTPGGYQLEARIPRRLLGVNLGVAFVDTDAVAISGVEIRSYSTPLPGPFVRPSDELDGIVEKLVQPGMRLLVTDAAGWRLSATGSIARQDRPGAARASRWLRLAYDAIVEPGTDAALAEPAASGLEQQRYISNALEGQPASNWFRSEGNGSAIVAVAQPIFDNGVLLGSVVLQRGTDEILSLTNQGLSRLLSIWLIAMLAVALGLLGYASWLSRRIRRLSLAAEDALADDSLGATLPSAAARDELGDLSRSFSNVLGALGEYNAYLRTLASKLSHELRTPLAIVTSSLDNLEHERLDTSARDYTRRARDGAERLRRILNAMSEANRVEELMQNAELGRFDLHAVLEATLSAYRDVYPERKFDYVGSPLTLHGSPELLIQMLDKLVDNAVSFSTQGARISIGLSIFETRAVIAVENPGPRLPDKLRGQLFDSLVSVREGGDDRHLGLGLYVARLIAEGHGGSIDAENTHEGVRFSVTLPLTG